MYTHKCCINGHMLIRTSAAPRESAESKVVVSTLIKVNGWPIELASHCAESLHQLNGMAFIRHFEVFGMPLLKSLSLVIKDE